MDVAGFHEGKDRTGRKLSPGDLCGAEASRT